MPSRSKKRKSSNKGKQITPISHSLPNSQPQVQGKEGEGERDTDSSSSVGSVPNSNHNQMDESEKNHLIEEIQKAEFKSDDGIISESAAVNSSETVNEKTLEGNELPPDQRKINVVDSDSLVESESSIDLVKPLVDSITEELVEAKEIEEKNSVEEIEGKNEVSLGGMDLVLQEIDSLSVENGIPPSVSKGIELCLDENIGVSSVLEDSVSKGIEETMLPASDENVVEAYKGSENLAMSELPENQPFIAVTPHPLQRTSWTGCCGLFEVLRHSNL